MALRLFGQKYGGGDSSINTESMTVARLVTAIVAFRGGFGVCSEGT